MNHLIIEALNECLREQNTELKAELASAKAVIEALRSVLSEDGVREHLAAYVMGVETMNRLDAYDARGK